MALERNELDSAGAFNTAASEETRKDAKKALDKLVQEYIRQSKVLSNVVTGHTRYSSDSPDRAMADKLTEHLQVMGFQISMQTLVCARLDGVDVDGMTTEIKDLIERQAPDAPQPRSFFNR